ncbi:hypothetical protein GCM10009682_26720 [Luedemannella flava]|uniref:Uncharacterized protein n=1 Tax=Luedemannella flava TaxID=349316 RepID=A0ABN2LZD2_9ACTN
MIQWHRAPRRLVATAVAGPIVVVGVLVAALFTVPPAAGTDGMPQAIDVRGTTYERAHLLTFRTVVTDEVTVLVPVTTQFIEVRASCRFAILHNDGAVSALRLDVPQTYVDGRNVPDTGSSDVLDCYSGGTEMVTSIDPAWLPHEGDQHLRLTWRELDTLADAPSNAFAAWAIAVYLAH